MDKQDWQLFFRALTLTCFGSLFLFNNILFFEHINNVPFDPVISIILTIILIILGFISLLIWMFIDTNK
jgi:hypothetical protein